MIKISDFIVTKPYGGVEQDDFVNGACQIKTYLSANELLELLHKIEANAGRERIIHWGPRTLDLDIIFYGNEVMDSEELTIPHVDMQNRMFVLEPLSQIAPWKRHPVTGLSITDMIKKIQSI